MINHCYSNQTKSHHPKGLRNFLGIVVKNLILALIFIFSTTSAFNQVIWQTEGDTSVLERGPSGSFDERGMWHHTVVFDGTTYHLWYTAYFNGPIGYAYSQDGISWTKHNSNPVLEKGPPGSWDDSDIVQPVVIKDDPLFKMWYLGTDGSKGRVGYATSTDGANWTKYAGNPVMDVGPAGSFESINVVPQSMHFDGTTYHLTYFGYPGLRIGYATSSDGINWTKNANNPVFAAHNHDLVYDGSIYNLWYEDGKTISYATSTDYSKWTKYDYNPVLAIPGKYPAQPKVLFDGEYYRMWYVDVDALNIKLATSKAYQHELGAYSYVGLLTSVPIYTQHIKPGVEIRNMGRLEETYVEVTCHIDSSGILVYADTQTVDTVRSLATRNVNFADWTVFEPCSYNVSYVVQLSNDENNSNDTLENTLEVSNLVDDFENGIRRWHSNGKWLSSTNSAHAGKFGLKSSLGNYENNADSQIEYLYSFNLSKLNAAHISYWTRYSIQTDYDFGYIEASADSGQTWQQLGDRYTGTQVTWKEEARSLKAFCGPGFTDVRIRFHFVSDSITVRAGWFIDDVNIYPYEVQTAITREESKKPPNKFVLYDNYPNPFNSQTVIKYQLPQLGHVKLVIYNMLGQEVKTLFNSIQEVGQFNLVWDGMDNLGQAVPSGVYLYRIQAEGFTETKKMLLLQ
jgi:hypothetical protein